MGFTTRGIRPALALFVIAHGLAQAVMLMRGSMEPATVARDFMPLILYGTSVLGFVIARAFQLPHFIINRRIMLTIRAPAEAGPAA